MINATAILDTQDDTIRHLDSGDVILNHCFTVTIPSTQHNNPDITEAQFAERRNAVLIRELQHLSLCFGGCTATEGRGAWVDNSGTLVVEYVTVLTSYCDDTQHAAATKSRFSPEDENWLIRRVAERVKKDLYQDAVLYTDDGIAHII